MKTTSALQAFNPAERGTPETVWTNALARVRKWRPNSRAMLVVSPHPDDEVLGAGGLLRSFAQTGGQVAVLSVTDGEAAYGDWAGLAAVRRRESRDALSVLVENHIAITHLSLPDGCVSDHREALFEAVDRLVTPATTLVAPYALDGHPDHEATGSVCCEIAQRHGMPLVQYPIWAWHHRAPSHFATAVWGKFVLDQATKLRKSQAIQCFVSQLNPIGREPIVPAHVLPYFERAYEAFVL